MTTAVKITDLLPIPAGTKQPHAYQVFGLEGGEQDLLKIGAAMEATVQRLNAAKPDTDPKIWGQAAKVVKQARAILSDSNKKAELDVRFGIVPIDGGVTPPAVATPRDPLAGVLPSADPLASVLPATNPLAPVAPPAAATAPPPNAVPASAASPSAVPVVQAIPTAVATIPPGLFGTPETADVDSQVPSSVMVSKSKSVGRRRRKSVFGGLMFATFALGMIVVIGGLGCFLFFGPGELAITSKDGQLTFSTKPDNQGGETTQIVEKRPTTNHRPIDPVMGRLAGNVPPSGSTSLEEDLTNEPPVSMSPTVSLRPGEPTAEPMEPMKADPSVPDPNMVTTVEAMPPAKTDLPPDSVIMPVDPAKPAGPANAEMTEEMVVAGEALLKTTRSAIRGAKWKQMKVVAEKATEAMLTDEQREQAESLYQVADLASFYRGGIERGIAGLTVGDDFEVTETLRVIVVEKRDDFLAIRSNAKTFTYTYDELPFVIAHKIARFSLSPDDPTNVAAKAVYQAIAPKSTDAYRDEAFSWLESIGGGVEGAEPESLIKTIKTLFAESPEA